MISFTSRNVFAALSRAFTHIFVVVFDFQNTFPNRKSYFENVVGELLFHVAVTYFAVIVFLFKISQRFGG